jgi:hypothetical protein
MVKKRIASSREPAWIGLLLLMLACADGGTAPILEPRVDDGPKPWLEVAMITREPRLPPPDSLAARESGWPQPGEEVRWTARVVNRGAAAAEGVAFRWRVDDSVVLEGVVDVPVGEEEVSLARPWSSQRERIAFELSPLPGLDTTTGDDTLSIHSDALSVGFWVHESIYRWMLDHGRPGFERQAQRWLADWNEILGRNKWSWSPEGVLDRLRLDRVEVIADSDESLTDLDTDLMWFFRVSMPDHRFLNVAADHTVQQDQAIVLHELLHQRGIHDLYAYEVIHSSGNGSNVGITVNGHPVAGSQLMPLNPDGRTVYKPDLTGLMGTLLQTRVANISEPTALGLNAVARLRTPRWVDAFGNNVNGFQAGHYANLLPATTRIRLRSSSGEPLAGAQVKVHADHGSGAYKDVYLPDADYITQTDADGIFELHGDILDGTPTLEHPKAWTLIIGVEHGSGRAYVFLPGYKLNLLHARAEETPTLELRVTPRVLSQAEVSRLR